MPKPMILVLASLIIKYMGGFVQKNGEKNNCKYFLFQFEVIFVFGVTPFYGTAYF